MGRLQARVKSVSATKKSGFSHVKNDDLQSPTSYLLQDQTRQAELARNKDRHDRRNRDDRRSRGNRRSADRGVTVEQNRREYMDKPVCITGNFC